MPGTKPKSGTLIVKQFLEKDAEKISVNDFREFWKDCSESDKADFAAYAAKELGYVSNVEGKYVTD